MPKSIRSTRRRYRTSISSVGNAAIEGSIEVPEVGKIVRMRAYVSAGTGTPTTTVTVWLTNPTLAAAAGAPRAVFDKIKAPAASATVDDSTEVSYRVTKLAADSNSLVARMGLLHLTALTSDATADHVVEIELEIETLS